MRYHKNGCDVYTVDYAEDIRSLQDLIIGVLRPVNKGQVTFSARVTRSSAIAKIVDLRRFGRAVAPRPPHRDTRPATAAVRSISSCGVLFWTWGVCKSHM